MAHPGRVRYDPVMKRRMAYPRKKQPSLAPALAVFALLLNTIFPAGWSLAIAAPSDPLRGDYVICPATGGLMPAAQLPDAPVPPHEKDPHCPQCRLPAPTAIPIPMPGASWVPNRIAVPVRYATTQRALLPADAPSVFRARAPPGSAVHR